MNANFEYTSNLQYQVKNLSARVRAFESGEKYTSMKAAFKMQLSEKDREIRRIKAELADAHSRAVTVRHNWMQVFEDTEKEIDTEIISKQLKFLISNGERVGILCNEYDLVQ
jgi:ATPase subunit of ABC transporter with duplicated ATPase domains